MRKTLNRNQLSEREISPNNEGHYKLTANTIFNSEKLKVCPLATFIQHSVESITRALRQEKDI